MEHDSCVWIPDGGGVFSVRSSWKVLEMGVLLDVGLCNFEEGVFGYLWKSLAPSKVVVLLWMLLDRIPSRANLATCNALDPSVSSKCVLFCVGVEKSIPLFLNCHVVDKLSLVKAVGLVRFGNSSQFVCLLWMWETLGDK